MALVSSRLISAVHIRRQNCRLSTNLIAVRRYTRLWECVREQYQAQPSPSVAHKTSLKPQGSRRRKMQIRRRQVCDDADKLDWGSLAMFESLKCWGNEERSRSDCGVPEFVRSIGVSMSITCAYGKSLNFRGFGTECLLF